VLGEGVVRDGAGLSCAEAHPTDAAFVGESGPLGVSKAEPEGILAQLFSTEAVL
jgi:hypothetical protein